MGHTAVALIVIGASVLSVLLLIAVCRYLGIWAWTVAWLFGSAEEKRVLTKTGHYNANGYMVSSESDLNLGIDSTYKHYDNLGPFDLGIIEETVKSETQVPPQPLRPVPLPSNIQSQDVVNLEPEEGFLSPPEEVIELPTTLRRAMSCDSVSSDTSVILETLQDSKVAGQLEISLTYDCDTADLIVSVIQAKDLSRNGQVSNSIDSYVRVYLLPDKNSTMHTRVQRRSSNPVYKERFLFGLDTIDVESRIVLFYVYACDKYNNNLIGEAEIRLGNIDLVQPFNAWLSLIDTSSQNSTDLGEIMFSLSYLPTAERLTVVVVKARNLQWTHNKDSSDPFVKIYLLQNGKKISKKKTSVKKDERNPIYNEAMIFSVPANALYNIQLRITVAEYHQDGRTPSIGHVIVGSQASGKTLSHWNQMMSSLRKPIAMWHSLRK